MEGTPQNLQTLAASLQQTLSANITERRAGDLFKFDYWWNEWTSDIVDFWVDCMTLDRSGFSLNFKFKLI